MMDFDRLYILADDGRTPVAVTVHEWAVWFETANRQTAFTLVSQEPLIEVSTIFLGLDYNVFRKGPPLLWETMIFGGPNNQWSGRWSSHDEALEGHAAACLLAPTDATSR